MTITIPISKTTLSGALAAVSGVLSYIATAPPELQNQIPQLFPEQYRGTIGLWLRFIAAASVWYCAHHTADSPPNPKETTPTPPTP